MTQLVVDGLMIELVRSKRRTLGLELSPNGIKARAPMRMSEADVVSFIRVKRAWIDKHLQRMPSAHERATLRLENGANLRLRGRDYQLTLHPGSRDKVRIQGERIIVPITLPRAMIETQQLNSPERMDSLEPLSSLEPLNSLERVNSLEPLNSPERQKHLEQRVKNKLVKWYKDVAHYELQTRARYFAALMDVPQRRADQIYVRDYKRRWGSCDNKGKLSFNWRIIQAPTPVSDYVIVHELAHCHEFNHSKRFWAIVAKQMPDYKEWDGWLTQNGHSLYRL